MSLDRLSSNSNEHDILSMLLQRKYIKHRNIFIGFGVVIISGITTFVTLRNYTYRNRDRLAKIRREIHDVTPGTESVFKAYHAKLKQRQTEKEIEKN